MTKDFGNTRALSGVSFDLGKGEVFGYIGPNGAGKTTSIRILTGMARDFGGRVLIDGQDASRDWLRVQRLIGYMPQEAGFQGWRSARHALRTFGRLSGLRGTNLGDRMEAVLSTVGLSGDADRRIAHLSGGQVQRLRLAQALIHDPPILVLDEPLSGLDPAGRRSLRGIIANLAAEDRLVFFSSHILADIELLCDRIAIIDKGKLKYTGPTREFVRRGRKEVEVVVTGIGDEAVAAIEKNLLSVERFGATLRMLCSVEESAGVVRNVVEAGGEVESVVPRSESLEDIFVRTAGPSGGTE